MMSTEERFDIYDSTMQKTGTATRREAHRQGLWHQTFQCWVLALRPSGWQVLVQLRQTDKDIFPDLLDTSCAGHLLAGESVEDGVRELREELDLNVPFAALHPCGILTLEHMLPDMEADREFCHVFIYRDDRACREYTFQHSEISGLFHISFADFKRLLSGEEQGRAVTVTGVELSELREEQFGQTSEQQAAEFNKVTGLREDMREVRKQAAVHDFVPHPKAYYAYIIEQMEQYIAAIGQ